ncbi:MAG TPA: BTAD domain-containing putative transcriptional regulator [Nitriliruptorales bacterium]|nr:BTAD domain-containing putative transcriptional regulator [Nitriliruptorales bacterium]
MSLRAHISNLRKVLARAGGAEPVILTKGRGYVLDVDPETVDAVRFERMVTEARRPQQSGDPSGAAETWESALGLWRGDALADVMYEDFAQAHIARLEELRLSAEEDRIEALLSAGKHTEVIPTLEATVAGHPLRERPHAQLMLALYRAGRTPHALEVFHAFRDRLVEEIGLDPSPGLVGLSDRILRQARELDLDTAPAASPSATLTHPSAQQQLVGREPEIRALRTAVQNLRSGRGHVLLVGGEAGIGKTSLLEELSGQARENGLPVHWGRCDEAEGAPPFWPWIQMLRSVVSQLTDDAVRAAAADGAQPVSQLVGDVTDILGERVEATGLDPESARFTLYEAVRTFLGRVAGDRGLVLVIDDLHWADTATLQLLSHVSRQVETARLLVAASYRSLRADRSPELDSTLGAVLRHHHAEALELRGLDVEEVGVVLAELADGTDVDELSRTVHERTGGNPFFVRQVGRLLQETRSSVALSAVLTSIPPGVRHVILQRLQLLPEAARRTLDAAAVVGHEFDVPTVAQATSQQVDVVLNHVDTAVAHGLVTDPHGRASTYTFAHALINETIQEELPPGALARLHAAVGFALEGRPHVTASDLAEHFWHAADLIDDDRPIRYMREAAEQALEVLAYEQGASLLRRALHLLAHRPGSDPRTEIEVRLRLIQLLTSVFGWTAEEIEGIAAPVRAVVDARAVSSDPDLLPLWFHWSLWTSYTTRGEIEASRELADTILSIAEVHQDPVGLVAGHVAVAYTHVTTTGEADVALAHCRQARSAEPAADPAELAATPEHLSLALRVTESLAWAVTGDAERALAASEEAIALAQSVGPPFREAYARLFAGWTAALLSDPHRALEYTEPGIEVSRSEDLPYTLGLTIPTNSWAKARLGEDPRAMAARVAEAVESLCAVGHKHAVPQWLLLLADIHLLAGDRTDAAARIADARQLLQLTGERFYGAQIAALEERLSDAAVQHGERRPPGPSRRPAGSAGQSHPSQHPANLQPTHPV